MLAVDEAHILRLKNKFHFGATELRYKAKMTVAMTATPVMTNPQVGFHMRGSAN